MSSVTKDQNPAEREFEEFLAALDWAQHPVWDEGRRPALSNREFDRLLDAFRSLEQTEPPSVGDHRWMHAFAGEPGEKDPAVRRPAPAGAPPATGGKARPEAVAATGDPGQRLAAGYERLLSGDAAATDGQSPESARLLALSANVQIQLMRAREGSALLVLVDGQVFGLPLKYVDRVDCVSSMDLVKTSGGVRYIDGERALPVWSFAEGAAGGADPTKDRMRYLVVVGTGNRRAALPVDAHLGAHQVDYGEVTGLLRGNKWLAGRGCTRNGLDVYIVHVPALVRDIGTPGGF